MAGMNDVQKEWAKCLLLLAIAKINVTEELKRLIEMAEAHYDISIDLMERDTDV